MLIHGFPKEQAVRGNERNTCLFGDVERFWTLACPTVLVQMLYVWCLKWCLWYNKQSPLNCLWWLTWGSWTTKYQGPECPCPSGWGVGHIWTEHVPGQITCSGWRSFNILQAQRAPEFVWIYYTVLAKSWHLNTGCWYPRSQFFPSLTNLASHLFHEKRKQHRSRVSPFPRMIYSCHDQ